MQKVLGGAIGLSGCETFGGLIRRLFDLPSSYLSLR